MKAYILAGGYSRRLKQNKLLYKFSFGTLIELSVSVLKSKGHIPVIVKRPEDDSFDYLSVDTIDITSRIPGSLGSFLSIPFNEPCLVLDGDVIYDPEIIDIIAKSNTSSCASSSIDYATGDEVYITTDSHNRITRVSKQFDNVAKTHFVGIVKITQNYLRDEMFSTDQEYHWDDHAIPLLDVQDCPVTLPWFELDFIEHIGHCENVYKKIYS